MKPFQSVAESLVWVAAAAQGTVSVRVSDRHAPSRLSLLRSERIPFPSRTWYRIIAPLRLTISKGTHRPYLALDYFKEVYLAGACQRLAATRRHAMAVLLASSPRLLERL